MDFSASARELSDRITRLAPNIKTEEATKTSLIMPFFSMLGYDVFNPLEFCPEYIADFGIKKGEKVDYAILDQEGKPVILIECKSCDQKLEKHGSQLFRYFGVTTAKFAILTNGIIYQFFTDLDETNKMDTRPFLEINFLDLKENLLPELKKFRKAVFDYDKIFSTASDLKYTSLIKDCLVAEMDSPSDDFVKCLIATVHDGPKTQKVIDKYRPLVKKSFTSFVNELVNQKISSALSQEEQHINVASQEAPAEEATEETPKSRIVTTEDELQAFYIVRGLLAETVPVERIAHRDTESYFGILFDDNSRKPICRINFDTKQKQLLIPDENKKFARYYLDTINNICDYKDLLLDVVKRYL